MDLSKIKDEIENRKKYNDVVNERLNGSDGNKPQKYNFLRELNESIRSGKPTESINHLRKVNHTVDVKDGKNTNAPAELPVSAPPNNVQHPPINENHYNDNNQNSNVNFNKQSDALTEEYYKKLNYLKSIDPNFNAPTNINGVNNNQSHQNQTLNEQEINSRISNMINEEMINKYTDERIKNGIIENVELIKKIVYEIIKELQEKNKKNKK